MTFTIFDRLHTIYCNDEMSAATCKYRVSSKEGTHFAIFLRNVRNSNEHSVNKSSRRKCKLPKINWSQLKFDF